MTIVKRSLLSVLVFFLIVNFSVAQDFPTEPTGHVNDFAGLLSSSESQQLETKLRNYRDTTTNVIAVATLPDLKGYSVEEAGTTLFNNWKMWHEDRYNGVLIVIAPNERKIRIEVGYGLEGAIPDVMAGRIIREVLTPYFKQGKFYEGLDRASSIMIQLAEGEFEGRLSSADGDTKDVEDTINLIIFILFLAIVIYTSSRRGGGRRGKRRRRHTLGSGGIIWLGGGFGSGGGGSGGGFGGFSGGGGFGSGGGGASGGW